MQNQIYTHEYPNGLVLIAEPMQSVESAAFTIRVPAGCVYEPQDRAGLATIANEMTLRGSGSRDSRQFVTDLDNLGVERGEHVGDAHTAYSGATLSSNLLPALEIYADLLRRPHLPAEQLEPARAMAIQELQSIEDEPGQKVMLELRRRHLADPWGRPSQGDMPGLEAATLDDVRNYFQRHYQPRGAVIGVAGNIDWPVLSEKVAELFGDWQAVDQPPLKEIDSHERVVHLDHESNQTQIGIAYPSLAYGDPEYFQAWGAIGVLSGGMSSRLFTEVREKRGLCYSVHASLMALRDRGSVLCYAGTTAERAQETLDVTLGELRRLSEGITKQELDRLKARIKSALIMQQESSSARSSSLAREWYLLGRVRTLDEVSEAVDDLTDESINAYLERHPPKDFTIVTLGSKPLEVALGV